MLNSQVEIKLAIESMNEKPLEKQFHINLEKAGHKLIRDEDGYVDIWRLEYGFHNGPECSKCGDSWCDHCGGLILECPIK